MSKYIFFALITITCSSPLFGMDQKEPVSPKSPKRVTFYPSHTIWVHDETSKLLSKKEEPLIDMRALQEDKEKRGSSGSKIMCLGALSITALYYATKAIKQSLS